MAVLDEAVVLNDGNLMPKFGVIVNNNDELEKAVNTGYRLINCPVDKDLNLREDNTQLYIEIEISETISARDNLKSSFKVIRDNLVANHADLCLLRLSDDVERNSQAWRELEEIKNKGWIKTIGVSNVTASTLDDLIKQDLTPSVVQVAFEDPILISLAHKHKLKVEMKVTGDIEALAEIAKKYYVSVIELTMRYFSQRNIVPVIETSEVKGQPNLSFTIAPEDMETIGQLFANE